MNAARTYLENNLESLRLIGNFAIKLKKEKPEKLRQHVGGRLFGPPSKWSESEVEMITRAPKVALVAAGVAFEWHSMGHSPEHVVNWKDIAEGGERFTDEMRRAIR